MIITSAKNPRIKQVVDLKDRREREQTGLTRVEGYEEVRFAVRTGAKLSSLIFCPELFRSDEERGLLAKIAGSGVEAIEVSRELFERVAYREGVDGWLGLVPTPSHALSALRPRDPAFIVVVDAVEKPGNLGAIVRTAEAAGVDALISADPVTDWGNPNVVRASKGAVFGIPVANAGSDETIEWLRARGIKSVVTTPQAGKLHTEADLTGPVAVVVGSEKYGVSKRWLEEAEMTVRIPMVGRIDSLNVATSAALLIYEVVRQRGASR
ncbi:MAG: RNA methyltransferase [Anaerolineae bacterium]|jgi:TrmH family RNA methyltransferase|nr:RNA methyltransferase [Anaerolineae bacterium]